MLQQVEKGTSLTSRVIIGRQCKQTVCEQQKQSLGVGKAACKMEIYFSKQQSRLANQFRCQLFEWPWSC